MSTANLTATVSVDPELTLLGRFLRMFAPAKPLIAGPVLVRIARNGRGGWSIYPVNATARLLLHVPGTPLADCETGNFATPTDATKRASWNAWDIQAP